MEVVVAGAHGQIARQLHPLLRRRGHSVRGLIRDPAQAGAVRAAGAEPVVCDLETEVDPSSAVAGADAVVFAAGAGPESGAARKWTLDRDGAVRLMAAARARAVSRFVLVSVIRPEQPRGGAVFQAYLQAKAEADQALRDSGLDGTIVRPGRLTDDPGTGRVAVGPDLERADIPRADVAKVLAGVVEPPGIAAREFVVVGGDQSVDEALRGLAGAS